MARLLSLEFSRRYKVHQVPRLWPLLTWPPPNMSSLSRRFSLVCLWIRKYVSIGWDIFHSLGYTIFRRCHLMYRAVVLLLEDLHYQREKFFDPLVHCHGKQDLDWKNLSSFRIDLSDAVRCWNSDSRQSEPMRFLAGPLMIRRHSSSDIYHL